MALKLHTLLEAKGEALVAWLGISANTRPNYAATKQALTNASFRGISIAQTMPCMARRFTCIYIISSDSWMQLCRGTGRRYSKNKILAVPTILSGCS